MSSETESLESLFVAEILGTLQRRVLSYCDIQVPRRKYSYVDDNLLESSFSQCIIMF